MPGAVIPAGPAPAPERGTRESRRQGRQINRLNDATFESIVAPTVTPAVPSLATPAVC